MYNMEFIIQISRLTECNRVLIRNTLDWRIIIYPVRKYEILIYENETAIKFIGFE